MGEVRPALAVMTAWTVITTVAYARPERRTPLLLSADLAVSVGLQSRLDQVR